MCVCGGGRGGDEGFETKIFYLTVPLHDPAGHFSMDASCSFTLLEVEVAMLQCTDQTRI